MKLTAKYLDKHGIDYTVSADGLITIPGDLDLRGTKITDIGAVESIGGWVDISEGASFTADALTSIGGWVYIRKGASLTADALTSIGGSVDIYEGASLTAEALTSIGGWVYIRKGASLTATELQDAEEILFDGEMFGQTMRVFDGIGAIIMSERKQKLSIPDGDGGTTDYDAILYHCRETKMVGGEFTGKTFYVASDGEHNAHGETVRHACMELDFKKRPRDVEQYRNMPQDTVKTPLEWAYVYREITGACQLGTKMFMDRQDLKDSYTLPEIIEATRGQYQSHVFREVVKAKVAA